MIAKVTMVWLSWYFHSIPTRRTHN